MSTTTAAQSGLTLLQQAQNEIVQVASEMEHRAASIAACADRATSIADQTLDRSLGGDRHSIAQLCDKYQSARMQLQRDTTVRTTTALQMAATAVRTIGDSLNRLLDRVCPQSGQGAGATASTFQNNSFDERVERTNRMANEVIPSGSGEVVFNSFAQVHISELQMLRYQAGAPRARITETINRIFDSTSRVEQSFRRLATANTSPAQTGPSVTQQPASTSQTQPQTSVTTSVSTRTVASVRSTSAPTSQTQPQPPVRQTVAATTTTTAPTTTAAPTSSQQPHIADVLFETEVEVAYARDAVRGEQLNASFANMSQDRADLTSRLTQLQGALYLIRTNRRWIVEAQADMLQRGTEANRATVNRYLQEVDQAIHTLEGLEQRIRQRLVECGGLPANSSATDSTTGLNQVEGGQTAGVMAAGLARANIREQMIAARERAARTTATQPQQQTTRQQTTPTEQHTVCQKMWTHLYALGGDEWYVTIGKFLLWVISVATAGIVPGAIWCSWSCYDSFYARDARVL